MKINLHLLGFYCLIAIGLICATALFLNDDPCAALVILLIVGASSYKENRE
jgi:hypothetical protein